VTDQALEVKEKLAQLESMLLESHPEMPSLLRDIHRNLKQDPDVVTLLSEDDCKLIVQGLKKHTSVDIATTALQKKGRKSMKNMEVGTDL